MKPVAMTKSFSISVTLAVMLMAPIVSCAETIDAVIYSRRAFQLFTNGASASRSVPCEIPVASFSVSPNGRFLVFASEG